MLHQIQDDELYNFSETGSLSLSSEQSFHGSSGSMQNANVNNENNANVLNRRQTKQDSQIAYKKCHKLKDSALECKFNIVDISIKSQLIEFYFSLQRTT